MSLTLNGSGTVTGLTAGGLPDATVTSAEIANANVTQSKLAAGVAGNGPAFSAYGTSVSAANATYTKLPFNSKIFDTNSNFDATTNYRFTPTVAGYYQINTTCQFNPAASNAGNVNIYKNGGLYAAATCLLNSSVYPQVTVSALVYCNGSTDYIESYCYQGSGGALNVSANTFNGVLVRSA